MSHRQAFWKSAHLQHSCHGQACIVKWKGNIFLSRLRLEASKRKNNVHTAFASLTCLTSSLSPRTPIVWSSEADLYLVRKCLYSDRREQPFVKTGQTRGANKNVSEVSNTKPRVHRVDHSALRRPIAKKRGSSDKVMQSENQRTLVSTIGSITVVLPVTSTRPCFGLSY